MFHCLWVIIIASHLGKENVLLYCTQVAKMVGSPVSTISVHTAYANTKLLSKVVIGSLSQKKGLQTIMKR